MRQKKAVFRSHDYLIILISLLKSTKSVNLFSKWKKVLSEKKPLKLPYQFERLYALYDLLIRFRVYSYKGCFSQSDAT